MDSGSRAGMTGVTLFRLWKGLTTEGRRDGFPTAREDGPGAENDGPGEVTLTPSTGSGRTAEKRERRRGYGSGGALASGSPSRLFFGVFGWLTAAAGVWVRPPRSVFVRFCLGAVPAGCQAGGISKSLLATSARSPGRQVPSAKLLPSRYRCVRVSDALSEARRDARQVVLVQPRSSGCSPGRPACPVYHRSTRSCATSEGPGWSRLLMSGIVPLSALPFRFRLVTLVRNVRRPEPRPVRPFSFIHSVVRLIMPLRSGRGRAHISLANAIEPPQATRQHSAHRIPLRPMLPFSFSYLQASHVRSGPATRP